MARPVVPSRSNYFKLYTVQALWYNHVIYNEIRDYYGHEQLASFIEYLFSISKNKHLVTKQNKVRQLINNKDFQGIFDYIDNNESKKIEVMYALLFDYAKQLQSGFLDKVVWELIFKSNKVYDDEPGFQDSLRSIVPSISSNLRGRLKKIINGYELYLKCLKKKTESKAQICIKIEEKTFNNKIVNIRQDYHSYDEFFNNFTLKGKDSPKFSTNTKVKILLNTLDYIPAKPNL